MFLLRRNRATSSNADRRSWRRISVGSDANTQMTKRAAAWKRRREIVAALELHIPWVMR